MIYERKPSSLVLYVLPITHILGMLPLVPVGDTGTFPHRMRGESAEFPGVNRPLHLNLRIKIGHCVRPFELKLVSQNFTELQLKSRAVRAHSHSRKN